MPLVFLIISSLLNIVLDIVFIVEFNMEIKGAAVATVISQANFCYIMHYIYLLKMQNSYTREKNILNLIKSYIKNY